MIVVCRDGVTGGGVNGSLPRSFVAGVVETAQLITVWASPQEGRRGAALIEYLEARLIQKQPVVA